jgi:glycosyltransferase involved in cell wall biosynthesis
MVYEMASIEPFWDKTADGMLSWFKAINGLGRQSRAAPVMKILFDHPDPFLLAHGGFQRQIEQTKEGLEAIGVEVEYLRWWDDSQKADLLHYFGRPPATYIQFAHQKRMRVVMEELLTGLGSRSTSQRLFQKGLIRLAQTLMPSGFTAKLSWDAYRLADACVANTTWEGSLMSDMFGAPPDRVHCVPNGVEKVFLEPITPPAERGKWLVSTATITERKRVLELAQAAVAAQTPLWVLGRPYAEDDPYAVRFLAFTRQKPTLIRYEGSVADRGELASIYRQARGFVLLSTMETLSLSSFEAAACGCPLLLSQLPWAWSAFEKEAHYCPITSSTSTTAQHLKQFYENAPRLSPPTRPKPWADIARQFMAIYETVLRKSW